MLDLHSNKISKIENISQLSELRVLNLANNLITNVSNLNGLVSLTELNLRRNLIDSVQGLQNCPRLQRVFLSNNRIEKLENIACIKDCGQLTELTLDGNPIYGKKGYLEYCLNNCPNLKSLDTRKVTVEMRNDPNSVVFDDKNNDGKNTDTNGQTITHDTTASQSDAMTSHIMPQVSSTNFVSNNNGVVNTTTSSIIPSVVSGTTAANSNAPTTVSQLPGAGPTQP